MVAKKYNIDFVFNEKLVLVGTDELNLKNSEILKISNTSFRVYLGPFKNLKSLKKAFNDISIINFENLEIIKQ